MKSLSQKYWIDKGSDTIPGTPIENNKPNPQQRSILVSPEIFIRSQEHIREVFTIEIEKMCIRRSEEKENACEPFILDTLSINLKGITSGYKK